MSVKRSIDSPLGRALSMALMAGLMLLIVGQASAEPVPLAVSPLNVADDGVASVYQTTGSGLVTPVANANDTEFTGDIENNLLTITGEFLGIQVDLAGASDLSELSAYVDPADPGTDPFKNTDSVEFLISTDSGVSFSSVGVRFVFTRSPGNLFLRECHWELCWSHECPLPVPPGQFQGGRSAHSGRYRPSH